MSKLCGWPLVTVSFSYFIGMMTAFHNFIFLLWNFKSWALFFNRNNIIKQQAYIISLDREQELNIPLFCIFSCNLYKSLLLLEVKSTTLRNTGDNSSSLYFFPHEYKDQEYPQHAMPTFPRVSWHKEKLHIISLQLYTNSQL